LRVIGIFGTGAILHFRKLNIAERFLEEQKELFEKLQKMGFTNLKVVSV